MRFSVTYKVNILPIGYRMLVLSLVKEALKRSNGAYYTNMFIDQKGAMKPFSSAVFLKDYSIINDEIQLKEITITFSSHDMEFMIYLFNGLQQIKEYHTGKETWVFTTIRMLNEATITSNSVFFRTLSPILIESKEGKPVHPMDENYEKDFNFYTSMRIKELSGRNPHQKISIKPISFTKNVIKETNSTLKSQQDRGTLFFTAYRGIFNISGHPEDLQLLYQSGVGKRASQSFGLLELEREE